MKIIVFLLITLLFFACVQQQVQPYKSGEFKLRQKYLSAEVEGTIYFYNQNQFYTTLAGRKNDYVFYEKNGRIHASCTTCTAEYIFHVTDVFQENETWTANISGSFLEWKIGR